MALVYDKPQLWLHMMDKLLEGGAHARGSEDLMRFADNLVNAYETRFVKPGEKEQSPKEEPTADLGVLKKRMTDQR